MAVLGAALNVVGWKEEEERKKRRAVTLSAGSFFLPRPKSFKSNMSKFAHFAEEIQPSPVTHSALNLIMMASAAGDPPSLSLALLSLVSQQRDVTD